MPNEEEIQTTLTCASDDLSKVVVKVYIESGVQTVYSYDPDTSNDEIQILHELRSGQPDHDGNATQKTKRGDDVGGTSADEVKEEDSEQPNLDHRGTYKFEPVDTTEDGETIADSPPYEVVKEKSTDSIGHYSGSNLERKDSIDDENGITPCHETGSNMSTFRREENSKEEFNEHVEDKFMDETQEDEEDNDDALVQTGMVLGTGTEAPDTTGDTSEARAKEMAMQTKFGGYDPDQSDTMIIQELQTGVPVHSEEEVVETQGDRDRIVSIGFNADEISNGAEKNEDDSGENVENNGNALDSGAQTFFSYDPMMSNSEIVDELANAYPKHSVENAVMEDSLSPIESPAEYEVDGNAIPKSDTSVYNIFEPPDEESTDAESPESPVESVEANEQIDDEGEIIDVAVQEGNDEPDEQIQLNEEDEGTAAVEETVDNGQEEDKAYDGNGSLPVDEEVGGGKDDVEDERDLDTNSHLYHLNLFDVDENKLEDTENVIAKPQAGTADNGGEDTDDGTGIQTMMTCASLEEYPKATCFMEQNTQTAFSYKPDMSNTKILEELKTKQPEHRTSIHLQINENGEMLDDSRVSDSNVIPELETDQAVDSQLALESIDNKEEEGTADDATAEIVDNKEDEGTEEDATAEIIDNKEDATAEIVDNKEDEGTEEGATAEITDNKEDEGTKEGETAEITDNKEEDGTEEDVNTVVQFPETISVSEDNDNYMTTTDGEHTDEGESSAVSDAETDQHPELKDILLKQKFSHTRSQSLPASHVKDAVPKTTRSVSAPVSGSQVKSTNSQLPATVKELEENNDAQQNTSVQTQIGFGTIPPSNDVNDKASNTYFSYEAAMSNSKIIEELTKDDPIHSQEAVWFLQQNKDASSEESLFNDDWEKNESSGEGEIEVQDIKASVSTSHKDEELSDVDDSDVEDDFDVLPPVVMEVEEGDDKEQVADVSDVEDDFDVSPPVVMDVEEGDDKEQVADVSDNDNRTLSFTVENEAEDEEPKTDVSDTDVGDKEGDLEDTEDEASIETLTQTDVRFGDTLVPIENSKKTAESALSVHITFSFRTGDATDRERSSASLAKLNEKFSGTIPILVTVMYERGTDESGNEVLKPLIELTVLRPPCNELRTLETDSEYDDAMSTVPDESNKEEDLVFDDEPVSNVEVPDESNKEEDRVFDDEPVSNVEVDELYANPDLKSEDTREIQIQTDLVLGKLLFSESISSVIEGGFEMAYEGPMRDEELILPSVPWEEPSSKADVSWGDGSLRDTENENADEPYDDLHLLVDPKEACGQQYVHELTPSSQENIPMVDKSVLKIMKIATEELLDVPDKVSSLTARNTDGKKVKVTGRKIHRWGFPQQNNLSNITILPSTYDDKNHNPELIGTFADDYENVLHSQESGRSDLTAVATRIIFEFQYSAEDFLSTDGRALAVKSRIGFQILEAKYKDNQSMHMVTLDLKDSMAPSKIMYMSNGEMMSKVLNPQGSPLELPIDNEPLVLKLSLPQHRHLDGSTSRTSAIRNVPFIIAQEGDDTQLATKDLKVGGSPLHFTMPLGDRGATMTVSAKIEDSGLDEGSSEFITMTTTFDEVVSPAAKKPDGDKCRCKSIGAKPADGLPKEKEKAIPMKEVCGTPKEVTAMVINDDVPGEKQTKILYPGGSAMFVDLPTNNGASARARIALDPTVASANTRIIHGDEDMSTNVSCKIIEEGVEKDLKSKLIKAGGSALCFDLPIGHNGQITTNVRIPKTDNEVAASSTATSPAAKIPGGDECICGSTVGKSPVASKEGGSPKVVTAMFINDDMPGEKQTKELRPGGSPMYIDLPSNNGIPARARIALNPKAADAGTRTIHGDQDMNTNISCKIIQDGVEKETKSKLIKPGGSALRFDMPLANGGQVTANIRIPKTDDEVGGRPTATSQATKIPGGNDCGCESYDDVTGSPADEDVKSILAPGTKGTTEKVLTPTGDRCFDIITEALATYSREIDPLRKALEEITEKVKELNMPELAGIGEHFSFHDLDELINQPSPVTYRHKITLRNGMSRISTTIRSGTNSRQNSHLAPSRNRTSYSLPDESEYRCPLAYPPNRYPSEQPYMQQQPRSYHQTYNNRPSNKCPFAEENHYSPPHNKTPAYGPAYQEPHYNIGFSYSEGYPPNFSREDYDYYPESMVDIRSRVYLPPDRQRSKDLDGSRNAMRQYNPDTGYDEYCRPQWSPLAEMYIKLAQNARSTEFYEEDEEDTEEFDDDRGYACQRRQHKKSRSRVKDGERRKFKCRECGSSSRDGATSSAGLNVDKKESYWCDPEDLTGSTKPGPLVGGGCSKVN